MIQYLSNYVELYDNSFDKSKSLSYHISIQLCLNGYSLCILDTVWNKYICIKHINFDNNVDKNKFSQIVDNAFNNEELFKLKYKSSKAIIISSRSTLIPFPYFDKYRAKEYFSFNNHINPLDEIHYNKLLKSESYNVFTVHTEVVSLFYKYFNKIELFNQASSFIENSLVPLDKFEETNKIQKLSVHINIYKSFFDIVVTNISKLLFFNSIKYNNSNDFVYFILNIYKQLKLDQNSVSVTFSGELTVDDNRLHLLKKYIKDVKAGKQNEIYTYSKSFGELLRHQYYNLFNLYQCAS